MLALSRLRNIARADAACCGNNTAQLAPTRGAHDGTSVTAPAGEAFSCLSWAAFARGAGVAPDVALCVGTARGRLLLYAPDGELIHTQRLHDTPVRALTIHGR